MATDESAQGKRKVTLKVFMDGDKTCCKAWFL